MTPPINPSRAFPSFSALWDKLRTEKQIKAAEATAQRMVTAPEEAIGQFGQLIHSVENGRPHGVGYASGPALDAGNKLQAFVRDASISGLPPSKERFRQQLVDLAHLERDWRRQLDGAPTDEAIEALRNVLMKVDNLQKFAGPRAD